MAKKEKEGKKEIPVPERSRATDFFWGRKWHAKCDLGRSFYGSTQMNQRGKDTSQKDQHTTTYKKVCHQSKRVAQPEKELSSAKIKEQRSIGAGRNNKKSKMTPPYVINRVFWQDLGKTLNSVHKVKGTVLQIQYRLVFLFLVFLLRKFIG